MTKRKTNKKPSISELRRKELQRLNLSPVKKKANYTKTESAKLKREYEKYQNILALDNDEIHTLKVKKSEIDMFAKNGFATTKSGKVYIPKNEYDNVQYTYNPHIKQPVIEYSTEEKYVHQILKSKDVNILQLLKNVDPSKNELPNGVSVTVQVGNNPFNIAYDSYNKLHDYLRFAFIPKEDDYENLINNMELVYFN